MEIINIQHFSDIEKLYEDNEYEFFGEELACPEDIGEDRIVISGPLFRLCGTDLLMAEGTYYAYDEDTGEHEPDFGVCLLYSSPGMPDLDHPLYWEQGTFECTFHNYAARQQSIGDESCEELERSVA